MTVLEMLYIPDILETLKQTDSCCPIYCKLCLLGNMCVHSKGIKLSDMFVNTTWLWLKCLYKQPKHWT